MVIGVGCSTPTHESSKTKDFLQAIEQGSTTEDSIASDVSQATSVQTAEIDSTNDSASTGQLTLTEIGRAHV